MAQPFKWDDENVDPLDGFDTDPTPSIPDPPPAPIMPKAKPQPPKPMRKEAIKPNRVAEVIDELEESPDPAELTEAEWRLEKAGYYRAVINSQLLSSDHPAAVEVEEELQEWAKMQLETLLGLRSMEAVGVQAKVVYESAFSVEETDILKSLAARALGRMNAPSPAPAPQEKKEMAVAPAKEIRPAVARPKAQVAQVTTEDTQRRGRGRPRTKPCRICGLVACEHKRTVTLGQPSPKEESPDGSEMYEGLPIQFMPDGTRFVVSGDGRKFRLDLRKVTHKKTGEVREAYIPVELVQRPSSLDAKPYPGEQEVMQLAAFEAERNSGAMAALQAATTATGTITKFTGNDLIKAAMGAPERESYIPEPPPRKR
jgi:hypothetical protein